MQPDSPAEYIAKLEAEMRSMRVGREKAEQENAQLRKEIEALNDLRAGLIEAAAGAAAITEKAIARHERDQPVVKAVYAFCRATARGAPAAEGQRLAEEMVRAVLEHEKGAPS